MIISKELFWSLVTVVKNQIKFINALIISLVTILILVITLRLLITNKRIIRYVYTILSIFIITNTCGSIRFFNIKKC